MKKTPRVCYLDPGRDYVRVKQGFSWPAFFFGIFWASAKKAWALVAIMVLVEIALYVLSAAVQTGGGPGLALVELVGLIAYYVLRGAFGNAFWRASLRRRGYQLVVEKNPESRRPV